MEEALQAVIAAVVAFFAVFLLSSLLILLLCPRTPKSRLRPLAPPAPLLPLRQPPSASVVADESASFDPSLDHISLNELAAATEDFAADTIIGDGSFGFVYKARLSSGTTVAVKRLSADAFHGFREFRAEMETLGRLHHPNLTRILGYCISGADRLLIYEFLEHGSLDHWLHESDSRDSTDSVSSSPLPWPIRVQIVRGVAVGLAFLHEECRPRIIHRDIKSSNVLLAVDFGARIADFGLARVVDVSRTHVSTQVAGTMGYMPPEYKEGLTAATVAADVYSFGVLMVETATGERPNLLRRLEDGKQVCLVRWTRRMVEERRVMEVLDAKMGKEGVREEEVKRYLEVAYRCTHENPRKRPTMVEVVSLLDHI
ncbi:putative Leucine-rich repeat receptor protein kinase MSP1 [Cocos nucifera]|uniref:Putative Leucine-rich repeat receptor protein kinase MSP1 n=1 Tax=Cocos nucifera TaxID=13894 RepID=A0A8K0IWT9_COCNU|nr:putative Leucine-rich repeat receptor protein kinase MSP1 [Cocos nucifera]